MTKYKDDLEKGYINGYYVGLKQGTKMRDKELPDDDGYDYLRETDHFGTVMQDAENPDFPDPVEEDDGNGEDNGDDDDEEGGDD